MKTLIKFLEPDEEKYARDINKEGPIITVSGFAGSGKTTVADWIARAMGLRRFSAGSIFRDLAKEEGITLEELSRTRSADVDHMTDRRTLKKGIPGGIVVDGRIAGFVFGGWADFRIFVRCPAEVRAERVARRDRVSDKEAYSNVRGRDERDREKYLGLYRIDIISEDIYDLVIDNSGSMEELKRQVDSAVRRIAAKLAIE